jgi:phosphotransferase system  glucose/maltose/N-acetylglucosamine-specific IIC component
MESWVSSFESKRFVPIIKGPVLRNSVLILLSFWENVADISEDISPELSFFLDLI